MQDRVPLYPGRVTLTPVAGQENTFDMARADQPTQEGTPLNKATLLKDATAAKFGKDTGAVPDEVLDLLSTGILHKPAKTKTAWEDLIKADFSLSDNVTTVLDARYAHGKFWFFKQTNVLESKDGKSWKSHPLSLTNNYGYAVCETPTGFALFDVAGTTKQVYFTTDFLDLDGPYSMNFTMANSSPWCVIYSALHNGFFATGQTSSGYGRIFFSQDAKTWRQIAADNIMNPIGFTPADNGGVYLVIFTNSARTYINVAEITPAGITYNSGGLSSDGYTGASPYVLTYYNNAIYMLIKDGVVKYDIDAKKITSISVPVLNSYSIQAIPVTNFAHKNKVASLFYSNSGVKLVRNEQLDNMAAVDWVDTGIILDAASGSNAALAVNNDFSEAVIVSIAANNSQGIYYSADVYGPEVLLTDVLGDMVNIPLKQITGATQCEAGSYVGTGSGLTKTIKCSFLPKLFVLIAESTNTDMPLYVAPLPDSNVKYSFPWVYINSSQIVSARVNMTKVKRTAEGVELTATNGNATYVFNDRSVKYYYVFIG